MSGAAASLGRHCRPNFALEIAPLQQYGAEVNIQYQQFILVLIRLFYSELSCSLELIFIFKYMNAALLWIIAVIQNIMLISTHVQYFLNVFF